MSSDSVAPPSVEDTCPYCLTFQGFAAETAQGGRFCPLCGADWQTLGRSVTADLSVATVNPFEGQPLPLQAPPPDVHLSGSLAPPQVLPPRNTPLDVPIANPDEPFMQPPPEAARPRTKTALAPATLGLMVGLTATLALALFIDNDPDPAPKPAPTAEAAPTAPAPPATPAPSPDAAMLLPVINIEAEVAADLPSPRQAPGRAAKAVEQAVALAARDLPPATYVDIKARVEDGIAFVRGRVDSPETLKLISDAASNVFGIRAVDSREVRVVFRKHIVRPGDTLSALAGRYYGKRSRWMALWDANKHLAKSPQALVIGEALLIPNLQEGP